MMKEHKIEINAQACIGCGLCVKDCPANNLAINDKKALLKSQDCIKCGHCVAICPKAAVSMNGFDAPPIELETQPHVDAGQLLYAFQARRSIRQFTKQPVAQEVINTIIEAGRWTPTAKNAPSVSYLVLQKEKDSAEELAVRFFKKIMPLAQLVYPAANVSSPLRKALGLGHQDKVVTTLVLGYSAVTYRRTTQKDKALVTQL